MKIELTDVSDVKKTLEIEAGIDAVAGETEAVLRAYAAKANIPGFRPGKAPLTVVQARFKSEIDDEVRDRLMSRLYHEAMHDKKLQVIGDPVVDEVHFEHGQPFRFKATLEVMPEVQPKDYKGIEVAREQQPVGEADIDQFLDELRQQRTQLVTEEGRAAGVGDVLMADVASVVEGAEAEAAEGEEAEGEKGSAAEPENRENVMVEVGSQHHLPAFNEKLEGATAGAELEFAVEYPKEFEHEQLAGKNVSYKIKVHEVKRKEVPELDDEFAKDLGDFDDLAALKERIREDLTARRKGEADQAMQQALLDKVLVENPVVLPEVLVEREIDQRLEDFVRSLMMQGMDPRQMELDWKDIRGRQEEGARKSVHARIVLDAIAAEESVEVGPEQIEQRIQIEAQRAGQPAEELKKRLKEGAGMQALQNQLVREATLDLLTSLANIQGEDV
ncbi:hypothetical protein ABI59_05850 [Acidobacteria bacterium Mor1]|nr:hypothetical protein ABI59_05850 [Acidobacteria bacterium Mor1]